MKPPARKVTLDDLSSDLNISKFSISRALGGKKGVSDSTRTLVIDAARRLGYEHPGLKTEPEKQRTQVQLVIPRVDAIDNPSWIEVISGAEAEARRFGWTLVTALVEEDFDAGDHHDDIKGILLAGRRSRGLLESYVASDVPVVLIGYPKPGEAIDTVHIADWEGGFLIGKHLQSLGHRQVAFLTDAPEDFGRRERLRGCRDALADFGTVEEVLFDPERERETSKIYGRISGIRPFPTAVVCASEAVCFSALMAFTEAGLRIPQDISVVTSNSTLRPAQVGFDVTALNAPMHELGMTAVDLLRQRLAKGRSRAPQRVSLCSSLNVKLTSATPRKL
jgi:LacI family transcriptional regulator